MTATSKAQLTYVTDTYCIWCWAFGQAVREFAQQNAERLHIEVLMSNMLRGERIGPIKDPARTLENTQRVTEMTGAQFGDAYRQSVQEANFIFDSNVSALAYHALHAQAPERDLDIAHALQQAWYWDGLDLHDEQVIRRIARDLHLDPDETMRRLHDPTTLAAAERGYARRDELNIKGYPTLLLHTPSGPKRLSGATATAEKLTRDFETLLNGGEIEDDED